MKFTLQITKSILLFLLLTALTQIGGLIYLLYKPVGISLKKKFNKQNGLAIRALVFCAIYFTFSFGIVPSLAAKFGRVPLPIVEQSNIKPANFFTWLANRHYVKPRLKALLFETTKSLPSNLSVIYLDANFPFLDGFPLIGHLSHDDGEKVDLAFVYSNDKGSFLNKTKTFSGYGIIERPYTDEVNQAEICEKRGFWQYSILSKLSSYEWYSDYQFDNKANNLLLKSLATQSQTGKIFIEPHLKTRLKLSSYSKLRFHGCHAVRHDDHIHLQL